MELVPVLIHNGKVKQIVAAVLRMRETGQWRILSPERMLRIMRAYLSIRELGNFAADISFC